MAQKRQPPKVSQAIFPELSDIFRTGPCVPLIQQEVEQWVAASYPGVTDTTKRLLNWWFKNDHPQRNTLFKYYDAQRRAVETLIYLYEVKAVRRRGDLLLTYARGQKIALPAQDDFARYAFKMATGSGKTKVMALAIAWQYFNAILEGKEGYANNFLLIAPNIIVLERLATDFYGGRIFTQDPIIPSDFKSYWSLDVYVGDENERTRSEGALYLTNIHKLYEEAEPEAPLNPVMDLLAPKPVHRSSALSPNASFIDRIARRGSCLVINDEAHHANDQAVAHTRVITNLHTQLTEHGLAAELDFSATPRQPDGSLFNWTVYDYSLKQAILDRVVKRPVKGVAQGVIEAQSEKASVRYEAYLVAAVERWQEYVKELSIYKKKPVLFMMLYDTKSADDVAVWMRKNYPQFFAGEKLLVIHTDTKGEISKGDLDTARHAARSVDDDNSPVQCIISVLMLKEGWDVDNVTVVVGLRPFTAKTNVLPEQAVGRGLRLMFRGQTGFQEHVDIIGNSNFMQVVEDLEKEEGIKLDTFEYGKKKMPLVIPSIQVVTNRIPDFNIAIPSLTPRIERKKGAKEIIEAIDITKIRLLRAINLDAESIPPATFTYEGHDVLSDEILFTRDYKMPQAQTSSEIIAFYAQEIVQSLKATGQFATLVPKIEQFLREKAFGKVVDLDSPTVLRVLNRPVVLSFTEQVFFKLLKPRLVEERVPNIANDMRWLSTTPPFPWSGKVADVDKTLFNLTPCNNDFEIQFAHFLDDVRDIAAFANIGNLPGKLMMEYLDGESNLRLYEPDFVARDVTDTHWLLETKGREDPDVPYKDARAEQWCEDVTKLTGITWEYLKVSEKKFKKLMPLSFDDLINGLKGGGPLFTEE